MKLNKESCRIFYGQISRKAMDEKNGGGGSEKRGKQRWFLILSPPLRVILGHKSYSVGRGSILATPAGNDFPNLSVLYHDVGSGFDFLPYANWLPFWSLFIAQTAANLAAMRDKFDVQGNVIQNQRNEALSARWARPFLASSRIYDTFCPFRGSIFSKLLHLWRIINLQSTKIEIERIFNNFHFSFWHNWGRYK